MDRARVDFGRRHLLHLAGYFRVTRAKSNLHAGRIYSGPPDRGTGVICDQTIALNGFYSACNYPGH